MAYRQVLDTNVLVAAFIAHGACHELLEHCYHHHEIVTTDSLLREFQGVLSRKFRFSRSDVREALQVLRRMVEIAAPQPLARSVCRDPDDDEVLAAALGGDAACIVTGDKDLLALKEHQGIAIISPDRFWRFEEP